MSAGHGGVWSGRARSLMAVGAFAAAPLLVCALVSADGGVSRPASGRVPVSSPVTPRPVLDARLLNAKAAAAAKAVAALKKRGRFSRPLKINNRMFPLVPGTEFVYRGRVVEGGESTPHSVVFTVTDLTKVVDHVRTVVAWDRDFLEGRLQEQELAFFAQDDQGNVWNFGEYPEEYENGVFTGAPDTWIRGTAGAYGGIHMLARPRVGAQYLEGLVPGIGFNDVSRVVRTRQVTCVPTGCYRHVLVIDEWSPNEPESGIQVKYYAPRVGLVRVGARGGDSQEFLTLAVVRHLDRHATARVRAAVLAMDRRAYRVSTVYRVTGPAVRRCLPRKCHPTLR